MKEVSNAVKAKYNFSKVSEKARNQALLAIADELLLQTEQIIKCNQKDMQQGKEKNLSSALLDRLLLDEKRVQAMSDGVRSIAAQTQVVGAIDETHTREDGLIIQKQRIPLGVIGMIFESRPNVVIDCSALAIKSGNCIILKGGKEAHHSNQVLTDIVRNAIQKHIPQDVVQLIKSREEVSILLEQVGLIDVIIPRGGEKLIQHVYDNSKIPVIAHFKGLCHIFIDESAKLEEVSAIILNAKTQRPGVCNAIESLLLHKNLPTQFSSELFSKLIEKKTELRLCQELAAKHQGYPLATEQDWQTEYLDNILSIKQVDSVEMAISHIQKYGSNHTEAILSQSDEHISMFQQQVDASSIMVNASTRFNDGGEFGLGAELGISTTKLHAYGPMGAKEMTTTRFLVTGKGHIRN